MNKKDLSELDVCTKLAMAAGKKAGWDEMTRVHEEIGFTKGLSIVSSKLVTRGKPKRADYNILYYKRNIPLALIESSKASR